jgi:hydroxymethylbilane synthase
LNKLREGPAQAIILAAAGLLRLEGNPATAASVQRGKLLEARLDPTVFVPAPGQGALAVQCRQDDREVVGAMATIHDPRAMRSLRAERRLLALVQGGCELPFGAWCEEVGTRQLLLHAVLRVGDGLRTAHEQGDEPEELAERVWKSLSAASAEAS